MQITRYDEVPTPEYRREFDDSVRALREKILTLPPETALERFMALSDELKSRTLPIRKQLVDNCLEWSEQDRKLAEWTHGSNQRMGGLGRKLVVVATKRMDSADDSVVQVIARSMQHIGSGMKSELASGHVAKRDYRELHTLMTLSNTLDCAAKVVLSVQGQALAVSPEQLFFRALLLARFANGALTLRQIEILDTWIWNWRALFHATVEPVGPRPLRADLDSTSGLRQGPRADGLPSLYLPIAPIDEALRTIVADFHAGRLERGWGIAAALPVAEYVAVLDVLRRSLARGEKDAKPREQRVPAEAIVEVLVGIPEITAKGFRPIAPVAPAGLTIDLPAARQEAERRVIQDRPKRALLLRDKSETGFGLEGNATDCRGIDIGTLVGIRLVNGGPLLICRVMRRLHDGVADCVTLGALLITSSAQLLPVSRDAGRGQGNRQEPMVFVPGDEPSGAQDGFLIPDSLLREKLKLESTLDDGVYAFRFNRVRQKGQGWSLAGFEIVAVQRPVRAAA